ncbi:hypothetical protein GPECTOR_42g765 [Gonium pectorale]|uniref:Peptidase M11 gametolysin domain-containing protein n=1 Tax=Gonium pectorale TaxID=33097 RepID=A0A150G9N6_GONPE|nr:hypothetical protein GPECTOR_42g765 [Gonium pectorale]|eukprot:KXZ46557.1 hypothetical protein GPECTOR_42g765 [Gonium pectorale]
MQCTVGGPCSGNPCAANGVAGAACNPVRSGSYLYTCSCPDGSYASYTSCYARTSVFKYSASEGMVGWMQLDAGPYTFAVQEDGNLVMYISGGPPIWAPLRAWGGSSRGPFTLRWLPDGLQLVDGYGAQWYRFVTFPLSSSAYLELTPEGYLRVVDPSRNGAMKWLRAPAMNIYHRSSGTEMVSWPSPFDRLLTEGVTFGVATDGNLCVYSDTATHWCSMSVSDASSGPFTLRWTSDGLRLANKDGAELWRFTAAWALSDAAYLELTPDAYLRIVDPGSNWSIEYVGRQPDCPAFPGYTLLRHKDHAGDDLGRIAGDIAGAWAACQADCRCRSFNTGGWFKSASGTNADTYSLGDTCGGFYQRADSEPCAAGGASGATCNRNTGTCDCPAGSYPYKNTCQGHLRGLKHSGGFLEGVYEEYGDPSDPMGMGYDPYGGVLCLSAPQAYAAGWATSLASTPTRLKDLAPGVWYTFEVPSMALGPSNMIRIVVSQQGTREEAIYVSYRTRQMAPGAYDSGLDPELDKSVWVHTHNYIRADVQEADTVLHARLTERLSSWYTTGTQWFPLPPGYGLNVTLAGQDATAASVRLCLSYGSAHC